VPVAASAAVVKNPYPAYSEQAPAWEAAPQAEEWYQQRGQSAPQQKVATSPHTVTGSTPPSVPGHHHNRHHQHGKSHQQHPLRHPAQPSHPQSIHTHPHQHSNGLDKRPIEPTSVRYSGQPQSAPRAPPPPGHHAPPTSYARGPPQPSGYAATTHGYSTKYSPPQHQHAHAPYPSQHSAHPTQAYGSQQVQAQTQMYASQPPTPTASFNTQMPYAAQGQMLPLMVKRGIRQASEDASEELGPESEEEDDRSKATFLRPGPNARPCSAGRKPSTPVSEHASRPGSGASRPTSAADEGGLSRLASAASASARPLPSVSPVESRGSQVSRDSRASQASGRKRPLSEVLNGERDGLDGSRVSGPSPRSVDELSEEGEGLTGEEDEIEVDELAADGDDTVADGKGTSARSAAEAMRSRAYNGASARRVRPKVTA
jgi:hypothetical protein